MRFHSGAFAAPSDRHRGYVRVSTSAPTTTCSRLSGKKSKERTGKSSGRDIGIKRETCVRKTRGLFVPDISLYFPSFKAKPNYFVVHKVGHTVSVSGPDHYYGTFFDGTREDGIEIRRWTRLPIHRASRKLISMFPQDKPGLLFRPATRKLDGKFYTQRQQFG